MLQLITGALFWHASIILGAYTATLVLILTGRSWGRLPRAYLRAIQFVQDLFPITYPKSAEAERPDQQWPQLINKPSWSQLVRPHPEGPAHFEFLLKESEAKECNDNDVKIREGGTDSSLALETSGNLIAAGIGAIVQDDFSAAFTRAPSYVETLNGLHPHPDWSPALKAIFYGGVAFRLSFLFPLRVLLFATSFLWLAIWAAYASATTISKERRVWVAVTYSRLFCAATGIIAEYSDRQHRPRTSGFAVSSHLSTNDAQILYADIDIDADDTYIVTGQRHEGIIGAMEKAAERVIHTLWLDRANAKERSEFAGHVLDAAKTPAPVLFFPEGYCANNTQLLQFRRSVFVRDVDIHPIAIRQDARYGDGFWFEDLFKDYILRLLTSWAVTYHVTYMPSMRRGAEESASEFACRVHDAIAEVSGAAPAVFDGGFWYKKSEQERVLKQQKETLATILLDDYRRDRRQDGMATLVPSTTVERSFSEEVLRNSIEPPPLPPVCSAPAALRTGHSLAESNNNTDSSVMTRRTPAIIVSEGSA